jgi:uncharacterized protein
LVRAYRGALKPQDGWRRNGFNTTERDAVLKEKHPDRFILDGRFDRRDGEKGLLYLEELLRK